MKVLHLAAVFVYGAVGLHTGRNELLDACKDQDEEEVRRLLASGADPNDEGSGRPIWKAARLNNGPILRLLIEAGGIPTGKPGAGCPLWQAFHHNNPETATILLHGGARLSAIAIDRALTYEEEGQSNYAHDILSRTTTLLSMASYNQYDKPAVEQLLHLNASITARDEEHDKTALDHAIGHGNMQFATHLATHALRSNQLCVNMQTDAIQTYRDGLVKLGIFTDFNKMARSCKAFGGEALHGNWPREICSQVRLLTLHADHREQLNYFRKCVQTGGPLQEWLQHLREASSNELQFVIALRDLHFD